MTSVCGHGYGMREHCDVCSRVDDRARRDFAWALKQIHDGLAVTRRAWNRTPRDFVFLVDAWECPRIAKIDAAYGTKGEAFIAESREDRGGPLPWTPAPDDLSANDWREWKHEARS